MNYNIHNSHSYLYVAISGFIIIYVHNSESKFWLKNNNL